MRESGIHLARLAWTHSMVSFTEKIKKLLNRIANSRGYHIERKVSYNEHELDIFAVLLDTVFRQNSDFYFMQIGAHDGCSSDPIHKLVKLHHWRGLLLEPQTDIFRTLVENYKDEQQLSFCNAALANADGVQNLFSVERSSQLASLDREQLEKTTASSAILEHQIQTTSFPTLIKKYEITHLDLLIVDTEGFDFEILKMAFNSSLPIPRLIRYEHLHLNAADRVSCINLLVKHGYKLIRIGHDTLALHYPPSPE